ncbi:uncharacterized protein LOC111128095 [Crassostrea virginica]
MNSVFSLLFLLGLGVCVYAGGYGGGANYLNYQQYYRPAYAQVQYYQPGYAYVQPSFGGLGPVGSGNLFAGSDTGSIIPIIIIFFLLAFFAPLLIGSLASSNNALWESVDSSTRY